MLVIPAIDLKDGQAVRLFKGDYNQKTVYSDHPEELAQTFEKAGAIYLHVVDLDGAKDGFAKNLETIKKIRNSTKMKIELGGGIRDLKTVQLYLDKVGIDRVILGTAALKDPEFLKEALRQYGSEKIVVGVDVKNGFVSTAGWLETSQMPYIEFIQYLESIGVGYIVATDISKDGTLIGPNLKCMMKSLKTVKFNLLFLEELKILIIFKKLLKKIIMHVSLEKLIMKRKLI